MSQVKLKEWYGRLGNNLTQLINVIDYCERHKYLFIQEDTIFTHAERGPIYDGLTDCTRPTRDLHSLIKNFSVNFSDSEEHLNEIVDFFYDAEIPVPNNRKSEILRKYVLPNFNYNNSPLDDTTLVIHIQRIQQ